MSQTVSEYTPILFYILFLKPNILSRLKSNSAVNATPVSTAERAKYKKNLKHLCWFAGKKKLRINVIGLSVGPFPRIFFTAQQQQQQQQAVAIAKAGRYFYILFRFDFCCRRNVLCILLPLQLNCKYLRYNFFAACHR